MTRKERSSTYSYASNNHQKLAKEIKSLPKFFEGKECPVHLDHCFARIVYDAILRDDWRKKVKAPAIRNFSNEQVQKGLTIVEKIKEQGAYLVAILNQQSLQYRNKKPKNKNPEYYQGLD